jgi:adenylate kinase family enzyme
MVRWIAGLTETLGLDIAMKSCRIHIMGASGSGVTSLGRALADSLAMPHHDTDDYFWRPTTPPYREMREAGERLSLMREMFLPRADWVLSGSLNGWGDGLIPDFDMVVFLITPREIRLQRLRAREATHFGTDALAPGGWRHQQTEEFIEWASGYEGGNASRNLAKHQAWLAALPCPVLRLDGSRPLPELVEEVRRAIGGQANPT